MFARLNAPLARVRSRFAARFLGAALLTPALFAAPSAEAQTPAPLHAGCQENIAWEVGLSDTVETVNVVFLSLDGDTITILVTGTQNDGFETVGIPCLAEGEYEGRIVTFSPEGEVLSTGPPRFILAVAPVLNLSISAADPSDSCASLVTFQGRAIDDCGISADSLDVIVEQLGGIGALGTPNVNVTTSGDTIIVTGSVVATLDSAVTVQVTLLARDGCGLASSLAMQVTIEDDRPPVITCPADIEVACTGEGGTPADDPALEPFFSGVTATDPCDTLVTITHDAPDFFPVGETVVTFVATDGSGNSDSCMATVSVIDTIPPTLIVRLNRDVLWPPNHKFHVIEAEIEISDECDPNPSLELLSIESNESSNGRGDGNAAPDIRGADFGGGDTSFELRAERSGQGDGRVYTIRYRAVDSGGNEAVRVAHVRVPHDRGGHAKASNGYAVSGEAFADAERVAILVAGWVDGFDGTRVEAGSMDLPGVQIGNTKGVLAPVEIYTGSVDTDGLADAVFVFDRAAAEALHGRANGPDDRTSLHFADDAGNDWVVYDIFDLGTPVSVDLSTLERFEEADDAEDTDEGDAGDEAGDDSAADQVAMTGLLMAQPNPFRPETSVRFRVPASGAVSLRVYDVAGRPVRVLAEGFHEAGEYSIRWDGARRDGSRLTPGLYFIRLDVPGASVSEKAILLK